MKSLNLNVPESRVLNILKKRDLAIHPGAETSIIQKLAETRVINFNNSGNGKLTISEATLARILGHLFIYQCATEGISNLTMLLSAAYLVDEPQAEGEVRYITDSTPTLLDMIIQTIIKNQEDVSIGVYPNGGIGFICTSSNLLEDLKPEGTPITTFSIYHILANVVGYENLPPLKSNTANISIEETELVNAFRENIWDIIQVKKGKEWKLECSKHGRATEPEINSLGHKIRRTANSLTKTGIPNSDLLNYKFTRSKKIS